MPPGGRVGRVECLTLGDAELRANEVDAAGLLGDGMLDLQAGVDFEEADHPVSGDEELDRARAHVAGLPADGPRGLIKRRALLLGEERRRGLLDEFLVAPLQRAVPGADDDDCAVGVREDLGLDVAGLVQVALDEALTPAERGGGLADRAFEELRQLVAVPRDLEPTPATAEGCLDGDRQPVLIREGQDLLDAANGIGGAGGERRPHGKGDVPGRGLVTQAPDGLGRRPDPGHARGDDRLGEVGVLRQEAVAGVDGVGATCPAEIENLVYSKIGVARCVAREGVRFVRDADMEGIDIGLGVHRDACVPGVPARADDPDSDFSPVGDEDLTHVSPVLVQRG